ncbi:MAG: HD domain-containing protein [Candidatus Saccharibacteria bacterium]|nr:HD domain-containing protein [Candidatus Saccharibacteria bacterium]
MANKRAVDPEIIDYIETKILPQYNSIGGHTDKHIHQVIKRSLHFYEQKPELNINMVYVIAAYHDLGRLVDNKTHNIESAKMLRADEFLAKHFTKKEIETMAEAVEDHRASLGHEPRSIYGKLVSSADRNTSIEMMLSRVFDYTKHLHPEMTEDEVIEEARFHLRRKYSPDGYAAKTMYFDDPDFANVLVETERITRDPNEFRRIMKEHNKKRTKK